jgi:hypothetical protein
VVIIVVINIIAKEKNIIVLYLLDVSLLPLMIDLPIKTKIGKTANS